VFVLRSLVRFSHADTAVQRSSAISTFRSPPDGRVVLSPIDLDQPVMVCERLLVFSQHRNCVELGRATLTPPHILEAMNTGSLGKAA